MIERTKILTEVARNVRVANHDIFQILIVDDDNHHCKLIKEILSIGYNCEEVGNGADALEAIKRKDYDAVLLDLDMGRVDGLEVCRRVRGELGKAFLPILIVTGSPRGDILESLDAGANDFISKPYSPMELLARLSGAVATKRMTDELDNAEYILFAIARLVEARDSQTGDHCARVAHCAVEFGKALSLSSEDLRALYRGGIVHDIGKLAIPDSVLLKPGPLNAGEIEIMQQHPALGESLCEGLRSMRRTLSIIRNHHERWDGKGYPDALAGSDIPLLARVFNIVDVHDALSQKRPYKEAWNADQIYSSMEQGAANGAFDPGLCRCFFTLLASKREEKSNIDSLRQSPPNELQNAKRTG